MSKNPNVAVLVTEGTNCDQEMADAFERAGGDVRILHTTQLVSGELNLDDTQILALPGGFGYGDRVGSGYVQGVELQMGRLGEQVRKHVARRRQVLGVCNGFQVLVRSNLLPWGVMGNGEPSSDIALAHNESNRFYNNVVDLEVEFDTVSSGVSGDIAGTGVAWHVAHGEGRLIVANDVVYTALADNGQIVLRYAEGQNFNGSHERIAGICTEDGLITGMMPHPERPLDGIDRTPAGLPFFERMVYYANAS